MFAAIAHSYYLCTYNQAKKKVASVFCSASVSFATSKLPNARIHAAAATNDQPKQTHFGGKSDGDAKDEVGGGGGGFGRADLQVYII